MELQKFITVKTSFEALHRWKDAPPLVEFLKYPHRHTFGVSAVFCVEHGNRALEFFTVKRALEEALFHSLYCGPENSGDFRPEFNLDMPTIEMSCEDMAATLFNFMVTEYPTLVSVTVDEDGENSGTATTLPVNIR